MPSKLSDGRAVWLGLALGLLVRIRDERRASRLFAGRKTARRVRRATRAAERARAVSIATKCRPPSCSRIVRPACEPKRTSAAARPRINGEAVRRLRVRLAVEVRSPKSTGIGPSELWRSRASGGRLAINPEHDDFPALSAEALDAVVAAEYDVSAAAETLGDECVATLNLKILLPVTKRGQRVATDAVKRRTCSRSAACGHTLDAMHICFLDIDGTLVSTGGAGQAAFVVTLDKDFGIQDATSTGVSFAGRSDRAIAADMLARCMAWIRRRRLWNDFARRTCGGSPRCCPCTRAAYCRASVPLLETLPSAATRRLGLITGNVAPGRRAQTRGTTSFGTGSRSAASATSTPTATTSPPPPSPPADCTSTARPTASWSLSATHPTTSAAPARSVLGASRCRRATPRSTCCAAAEPDVLVETLEDVEPILRLLDA